MKLILKEKIKKIIKLLIPKKYQLKLIYFYLKMTGKLDAEMLYVSGLIKDKRRFIDIGANLGIYSYHFKNLFQRIDSFEPLSEASNLISSLKSDVITLHNVGLSDKKGEIKIYVPYENGKLVLALASFEKREGKCEEKIVEIDLIDNYQFMDVDLIKIDVEGHEKNVIMGAQKTIKRNMPIMIIEIEQRHISYNIEEIFQMILNFDYNGFFLKNYKLISLKDFKYETDQKPFLNDVSSKRYINNFIFIPKNFNKN